MPTPAYFTSAKTWIETQVARAFKAVDVVIENALKMWTTLWARMHNLVDSLLAMAAAHSATPGKILMATLVVLLAIALVTLDHFHFIPFLLQLVKDILASIGKDGFWPIVVIIAIYLFSKKA